MSSANYQYEEKRNYIRMFVDAKVTITDPTNGEVFEGQSQNLSGDGVMFTTDRPLEVGQKLQVNIQSEQSKLAPLSAEFEVIRSEALPDGKFEVAGSITGVS